MTRIFMRPGFKQEVEELARLSFLQRPIITTDLKEVLF